MNKIILTLLVLSAFAGCASVDAPFDPSVTFKTAEANMRKADYEKARKGYQEIQEKSPDKSYDAFLMLRVADTYFGEEKYSEALVEYQAFLNYHPVHKDAAYAQYQIAICNFRELTSIDRDPAPARAVITEMRKILQKYPASEYGAEAKKYIAICTDWLSEYELYVAHFYYKKGAYKAAIVRCEKLLKDYPGSVAEKDAIYFAGLSYMERGDRDEARGKFEMLAQKYPSQKEAALALIQKLQNP
jgi:outer membrane protein assembly factor BamD